MTNDDYGNTTSLRLTYESFPLLKATGVFKHIVDVTEVGTSIRHRMLDGNDTLLSDRSYDADFMHGYQFIAEVNDAICPADWKPLYGPPYESIVVGNGAKWRVLLRFSNHRTKKISGALEPGATSVHDDLPPNAEKLAFAIRSLVDFETAPVLFDERLQCGPCDMLGAKSKTSPADIKARHDQIRDLTLMLMYLTSWEEGPPKLHGRSRISSAEETRRLCWKGYDFNILNELTEQGLVDAGGRSGPAVICDDGAELARILLRQYKLSE